MPTPPVTGPARRPLDAASPGTTAPGTSTPLPDDGTRPLLQTAFWVLVTGLLAAAATRFVFGGIGEHGPHTNAGWLALIVAMMCLPFGAMVLLLGGAKYLRNQRLTRRTR